MKQSVLYKLKAVFPAQDNQVGKEMGQEKQLVQPTNVFLSYSHNDQAFAQRLVLALQAAGYDVWIDKQNIPRAREWLSEIYEGIENADAFLTLVSPYSLLSDVCNREIAYARECRKQIIPLIRQRIAEKTEKEIVGEWFGKEWEPVARQNWEAVKQINWIFFDDDAQFDAEIATLLETLNQDIEFLKTHKRLLVRALEWDRHERNPERLLRGKEITDAEAWLASSASQQPGATTTHVEYINASRAHEHDEQVKLQELQRKANNRLRYMLVATLLAVVGIVAVLMTTINSQYALDQQNRQTLETLAENSYNGGNYEQARAYFTALVERFDSPAVHVGRGRASQMLGLAEEAAADFTVFLQANPNSADVYVYRGNAYTTAQKYNEALVDYNRAVELNPNFAEAFRMRGHWQYIQGNFQLALVDLNHAISLNESFAEAYNDRGLIHFEIGDLDKAKDEFLLALRYESEFPEAHVNLGRANVLLGLYDEARENFDYAIIYKSDYAPAWYHLALLRIELEGSPYEAISAYRFATAYDSEYAQVETYIDFMNRLNLCEEDQMLSSSAELSEGDAAETPLGITDFSVPPPGGGTIHTIQPEDKFFDISRRYGVSLSALLAANPQFACIGYDVLPIGGKVSVPI